MKPIVAALALAASLTAGEARAQHLFRGKHAQAAVTYGTATPAAYPTAATSATAQPVAPRYPYSYYAAFPNPARGYMGYGEQDGFPYYGRAYGHAYDRWTWPYLTDGANSALVRYYDPPVK